MIPSLFKAFRNRIFIRLLTIFFCFGIGQTSEVYAQEQPTPMDAYVFRTIILDTHYSVKTRQYLIYRELELNSGHIIPKDSLANRLLEIEQRLFNLQLFTAVAAEWKPDGDSIDLFLTLKERFPIFPQPNLDFADRNFNVWWNEQGRQLNRINIGLELTHNNFRGNREILSLGAQIGYTQQLSLHYERPFIDRQQKHGLGFSLFAQQNREIAYQTQDNKLAFYHAPDDYMQRRIAFVSRYLYRPKYASNHTVELGYAYHWTNDTLLAINADYWGNQSLHQDHILSARYIFRHNKVDNWNYPTQGYRFVVKLNMNWAVQSKAYLADVHWQADYYKAWNRNWYSSIILRGRLAHSNSSAPPYFFHQNLGYEQEYVRGYEYYVIDGKGFGLARLNQKFKLFDRSIQTSIRYLHQIPIKVFIKGFADVGYSLANFGMQQRLNEQLLTGYGIGIDIITLYDIKVRFEYTFNRLGEKGLFLHRSGE